MSGRVLLSNTLSNLLCNSRRGPDLAYDTVFTLNLPVELDLKSATDLHGVACAEGNYLCELIN